MRAELALASGGIYTADAFPTYGCVKRLLWMKSLYVAVNIHMYDVKCLWKCEKEFPLKGTINIYYTILYYILAVIRTTVNSL